MSGALHDENDVDTATELEDRQVAQHFILSHQVELEGRLRSMNDPLVISPSRKEAPPVKPAARDSSKGRSTATRLVTDEVSKPISEVHDDGDDQQADESSVINFDEDHDPSQKSELGDEVERKRYSTGSRFHQPHSGEVTSRVSCLQESRGELEGKVPEFSQSSALQQNEPTEVKLNSIGDYVQQSDSQGSSRVNSHMAAADIDAVSYLNKLTREPPAVDESTEQSGLESEISFFYPQQLEPEDISNPFSLEDRIRKAREDQDIALQWEAESLADARLHTLIEADPQQFNSDKETSSISELEKIYPDDSTNSPESRPLLSKVKERTRTGSPSQELVEQLPQKKKTGMHEAVLLGALASGVNRPTWLVIQAVLVALVASIVLLLHVAIQSASYFVLVNVLFLGIIAGGLIYLLSWYISEIGLVSVEKQMAELNLTSGHSEIETKTL